MLEKIKTVGKIKTQTNKNNAVTLILLFKVKSFQSTARFWSGCDMLLRGNSLAKHRIDTNPHTTVRSSPTLMHTRSLQRQNRIFEMQENYRLSV